MLANQQSSPPPCPSDIDAMILVTKPKSSISFDFEDILIPPLGRLGPRHRRRSLRSCRPPLTWRRRTGWMSRMTRFLSFQAGMGCTYIYCLRTGAPVVSYSKGNYAAGLPDGATQVPPEEHVREPAKRKPSDSTIDQSKWPDRQYDGPEVESVLGSSAKVRRGMSFESLQLSPTQIEKTPMAATPKTPLPPGSMPGSSTDGQKKPAPREIPTSNISGKEEKDALFWKSLGHPLILSCSLLRLRRQTVIHKDRCSAAALDLWKTREGRFSTANP